MQMSARYGLILDALILCFSGINAIGEGNYHDIVRCMREYATDRDPRDQEVTELRRVDFPENYDPLQHMQNIRWGCCFGGPDREDINWIVGEFDRIHNSGIRAEQYII
eukprot:jgi/Tetstr1/447361/TSEL_034798.t1